jgi:A/G-specific adenine glycosylase
VAPPKRLLTTTSQLSTTTATVAVTAASSLLVSELMLQQTQVARVIPKYQSFLEQFPDVQSLAMADLSDVLRVWQGLGYNRRAKFLWQAAGAIDVLGNFPTTYEELVKLPGIGSNTAGAILAYACNQPVVFVETNVRTVYIHHFFADRIDIHDREILSLVGQTLDREHPRALNERGRSLSELQGIIPDHRLEEVLRQLVKEGMIRAQGDAYFL